ncbi:MAG TPA: type II secretion system minor pseudopilin GspI [Steroidobacteraceae bacterium]|nr:type II secretion system minor pseudopilin GspI [Steroidobacteraceae bacterium]
MSAGTARGFTLIEVLVALMIVALGLAALMTTIGSAADTSGYLRDKTIADWIAMNRIVEVRLNLPQTNGNGDKRQLRFANRYWHYDTRYYPTSIQSMRRIDVRVWAGKSNAKGAPLAEAIGFIGNTVAPPGSSNMVDWTTGSSTAGLPNGGAANGSALNPPGILP